MGKLALEQAIADNGDSFRAAYVDVPGIAPLDRRDVAWRKVMQANSGIEGVAQLGTLDKSVAIQARSVLQANPDVTVIFAPCDAFAKGVKFAVDEAGLTAQIDISSADISTADIAAMREPGSAWAATVATNPAVVGEVSVLLAGEDPGHNVVAPPTLITQAFLSDNDVSNMEGLAAQMLQFAHAEVATPDWLLLPERD